MQTCSLRPWGYGGSPGPGNRLEVLLVTMRPEGTSGSRLHTSNTELFMLVLAGSVRLARRCYTN